jgi:hypothetical protein
MARPWRCGTVTTKGIARLPKKSRPDYQVSALIPKNTIRISPIASGILSMTIQ